MRSVLPALNARNLEDVKRRFTGKNAKSEIVLFIVSELKPYETTISNGDELSEFFSKLLMGAKHVQAIHSLLDKQFFKHRELLFLASLSRSCRVVCRLRFILITQTDYVCVGLIGLM